MGNEEWGMGNVEWGMGNGEWGMGNGEWGMGNGEWGMGNGVWGMGNGEWGMGNGVWGMGNGKWEIVVSAIITEKLECAHRRKYSSNTGVAQYAGFLFDVHVGGSSVISSAVSPAYAWKVRVFWSVFTVISL